MNTLTAPPPLPADLTELARYRDENAQPRRIALLTRTDGSVLVIDALLACLAGARLIADLAPDEPPGNAQLVCELYLADETRGRCRALLSADLDSASHSASPEGGERTHPPDAVLYDSEGHAYTIGVPDGGNRKELRWTLAAASDGGEPLELRAVVAGLEDYEPARSMTRAALAAALDAGRVSCTRLRGELERLEASPIVLNRALREAVQRTVERGEMSMSEIAMRCGRTKRDKRGNISGETSWLARRIGQAPDAGETLPRPWIRSDVLALIAREGLGIAPHEVEL
jgi:hypothetical protein